MLTIVVLCVLIVLCGDKNSDNVLLVDDIVEIILTKDVDDGVDIPVLLLDVIIDIKDS